MEQQILEQPNNPSQPELENNSTPNSISVSQPKIFCHHLGVILNNLGIFTCIAGIFVFFSFLIVPLYMCLLILLTLATLGTIFLIIPNFGEWWALLPKLAEK